MTEAISILIPTFNRGKYIKDCLDSILNQTYDNLRILIYDDGSTDNTVDIIKSINDPRIELEHTSVNGGVGVARNMLLTMCNTEIAAWMDSDDLAHSRRIEMEYHLIKDTKNLFVITQCGRFNGNKYYNEKNKKMFTLDEEPQKDTLTKTKSFATVMFRNNHHTPTFHPDIKMGGEDTLWMKHMYNRQDHVIVDKMLYYVRFHNERIGTWKKKPRNIDLKRTNDHIFKMEMDKVGKDER